MGDSLVASVPIFSGSRNGSCARFTTQALSDLAAPPGNRLEALTGRRVGQHSIRINQQWRVCFVWNGQDAENVEIVDYHCGA